MTEPNPVLVFLIEYPPLLYALKFPATSNEVLPVVTPTTEAVAAVPLAYRPWGSFWSQGLVPDANPPGWKRDQSSESYKGQGWAVQSRSFVLVIVKKYVSTP